MIIDRAAINLHSTHYQQRASTRSETLKIEHKSAELPTEKPDKESVTLSHAGKVEQSRKLTLDLDRPLGKLDALVTQIIRRMVKEITGQDLKLFSPDDLQTQVDAIAYQEPLQAPESSANSRTELLYEQSMSYFESEDTEFSAEGVITTQDGKRIDFSVSLTMSRSFYLESNLRIGTGEKAKTDPLVINFDGNAAELSDTFFQFDIDADGRPDQIATLKAGSAMLALDQNQDGLINDGSELFGPKTGDGFAELASYDEDHNQFIDEADAIYSKLRIWQRHADGSQQLLALGEKNIGAIYLGHVSTPFQLNTEQNTGLGEITSSGIYLTEQGSAGSVQQINFIA